MRRQLLAAALTPLSVALILALSPRSRGQDDTPAAAGIDVMARGPVHEAYAEPAQVRPEPSPVIPRQPPDPIQETPPDQKPEGDNVIWIPGYWAWDSDRNDFIWVSGCWRDVPPNRQWTPGAWQEVEGGCQWTPGFWSEAGQEEFQYLPDPPASVEEGPNTPIPDEDSTYVPGCWVWREGRYLWRPGFWQRFEPGWVWITAHYIWTPAGCVFVDGYWDFPLEQRGLLFAPVAVTRRFLAAETAFVPSYVVQPDFLLTALFVRPETCHYYFGDYFSEDYLRAGYIPWVNYRIGKASYDCNYAYYRHALASREWESNLRSLYAARFEGTVPRPPRTFAQQSEVLRTLRGERSAEAPVNRNINMTRLQNASVLAPLNRVHNLRVTNMATLGAARGSEARPPSHVMRLQEVPRDARLSEQRSATRFHEAAQQRRQEEHRILPSAPAPHREAPPPRGTPPHREAPPQGTAPPHRATPPPQNPPPPHRETPPQRVSPPSVHLPAAHPPARPPAASQPHPQPPAASRPTQPQPRPAPHPPAAAHHPAPPAPPKPPAPVHHQPPPMPPHHDTPHPPHK
jgi:hypothetical protein